MRKLKLFLPFLFMMISLPAAMQAQRALRPGDIYKMKAIRSAVISPDGKWVLYNISSTDSAKDRSSSDLWMSSWDGKETIQLTSSPDSESDPQWSPDGKYISFISSRETGKSQVWLLDRRGGEGIRLTDEKMGVNAHIWSPDSKKLLLSETDPADTASGKRSPYVINRYQFKQDVQGYKYDTRYTHLYLFDVAAKKTDTLTSGAFNESGAQWSPDSKQIVFASNRTADPDRNRNTDLYLMEARANAPVKQLTTWPGSDNGPRWSPDGKSIAYVRSSSDADAENYEQGVLCIIPAAGGEPVLLSKELDRPIGSWSWKKDSRSIGVVIQDDARSYAGVYDLKKNTVSRISEGDRSYGSIDASPSGAWLLSVSEWNVPSELYTLTGDKLQRLTNIQKAVTDSISFGAVEKYTSTSSDGTLVSGTLIFPLGKGRTNLPLVLNIHGGPVSQNEIGFDIGSQMLAAQGYLVATVNYRGSSGRGWTFSKSISGDWGNLEVIDILGAVDHLVAKGFADSTRLGIYGWSYGGILTDYVIASTKRFKAASSGAGVAAPLSLYGVDQ